MPTDELPEPTPEAADAADAAYQAGYDSGSDARSWLASCLKVLTAEIDLDGYDPMSRDAVREMRCEAARRVARICRLDREAPDQPE